MKKKSDWYNDFFDPFRPAFEIFTPKVNNSQTRYFIKKLGLEAGMKFLDCPCGIGRIAIPMAKKGIRITGVDLTESYLEELDRKASKLNLPIKTVCRDMRRIDFKNEFHAAGNIWTSFGFFEKEEDNFKVLKKLHQALKPGGKVLLHLINRDFIIRNFHSTDWLQIKDTMIMSKRYFNFGTSIMHEKWKFIRNGKTVEHETRIRMYSYHELIAMLERARFVNIEGFGSVKDEPVSPELQMMFIFGTKVF
jgi:cyclopropane fatty-acyl-phospholipid synthase-like methyltransferase